MNKLPTKLIEQINTFLTKYGFVAKEEYLNKLLEGTELKALIIENNGFDTAEREMFFEMLAKKLTGSEWPCNADPDHVVDDFREKFVKAVRAEKSFTIL